MKIGRNDPCHCGSGQKYKKCHLPKDDAAKSAELAAAAAAAAEKAQAEAAAEQETEGATPAAGPDRTTRANESAGARPKASAPTPAPTFRRKAI